MDFFDAQDRARGLTRRLVFLFALAVAGMMAVVYLTLLLGMGLLPVTSADLGGSWSQGGLVRPELLAAVVVGMGAVIGGGTAFRTAQLRRGGAAVAELLGGRRVDPSTDDPRERVLLNVVEEMAIASGLPVPAVYVMDREPGINAFAAGHTTSDAAVAVTRGTLEELTRDELQGVVAHEFSHILNGDMRLNVRLMGLLFGILLLTVVGRGLLRGSMGRRYRSSSGRGGSGGQVAILGVVLVALGYLGVFFGRLIQAAVSRQREFLADAAAVQFTRNPDGLAGALKRIGASSAGSRIQDHHAQEAGHLFFAGGVAKGFSRLSSTHPPIPERIRRIDRHWDGTFQVEPPRRREGRGGTASTEGRGEGGGGGRGTPLPFPLPGFPGGPRGLAEIAVLPLAAAGNPGGHHVAYARQLLEAVPGPVREAVRTPEGAVAVLLALLLAQEPQARGPQEERIRSALGEPSLRRAEALRPGVRELGAAARLPLVELALPALRELPRERRTALRNTAGFLIQGSDRPRTFHFALFHLLQRHLGGTGEKGGSRRRRGGSTPLPRLTREVELLLSAVARTSSRDEDGVERAFQAGASLLPALASSTRLQGREALGLDRVDEALGRLETAAPGALKDFLQAAAAVIQADGLVEVEEAEMLRALAEALDVPLPPFLPDPEAAGS